MGHVYARKNKDGMDTVRIFYRKGGDVRYWTDDARDFMYKVSELLELMVLYIPNRILDWFTPFRSKNLWWTDYHRAVNSSFRDIYGFKQRPETSESDPAIQDVIPEGEYPMEIGDQIDYIQVKGGMSRLCNIREWDKGKKISKARRKELEAEQNAIRAKLGR